MTACRPSVPQPRCSYCCRISMPTMRRWKNGYYTPIEVIDPTAVLKYGKACPLYERAVQPVMAATPIDKHKQEQKT
jgi:hypothetical protein